MTCAADLLPHAPPFVLVDRVIRVDRKRARVLHAVTRNDALLRGYPTMPPTLIVEALAQAAGVLVASTEGTAAGGLLTAVDDFVFHGPVCAGEQLVLDVNLRRVREPFFVVVGRALVGEEVRAEGKLTLSKQRAGNGLTVRDPRRW